MAKIEVDFIDDRDICSHIMEKSELLLKDIENVETDASELYLSWDGEAKNAWKEKFYESTDYLKDLIETFNTIAGKMQDYITSIEEIENITITNPIEPYIDNTTLLARTSNLLNTSENVTGVVSDILKDTSNSSIVSGELTDIGRGLATLAIGCGAIENLLNNMDEGAPASELIGDAVVDMALGGAIYYVCGYVGSAAGGFIGSAVPGAGTVVGAVVGAAAGAAVGNGVEWVMNLVLDKRIGECTIKEHIQDSVTNFYDDEMASDGELFIKTGNYMEGYGEVMSDFGYWVGESDVIEHVGNAVQDSGETIVGFGELLGEGGNNIEELGNDFIETGYMVNDFADTLSNQGVAGAVVSEGLYAIGDVSENVGEVITDASDYLEDLGDAAQEGGEILEDIGEYISESDLAQGVGNAIETGGEVFEFLGNGARALGELFIRN